MKARFFISAALNAILISFLANCYVLIELDIKTLFVFVPVFVLVNLLAGILIPFIKNVKLLFCQHGTILLYAFYISIILSLIYQILYAVKVSFENEFYAQNYVEKDDDIIDCGFHNSIISSLNKLQVSDFKSCLDDFIKTIKHFIYSLPYYNDLYIQNIYVSCILSFLNSVVLSKKHRAKLNKLRKDGKLTQEYIDKLYKKERENCIILYHLDDSMKDYIKVLVNEIRHLVAQDLSEILNDSSINFETNIKNMLILSINSDLKTDDDYD